MHRSLQFLSLAIAMSFGAVSLPACDSGKKEESKKDDKKDEKKDDKKDEKKDDKKDAKEADKKDAKEADKPDEKKAEKKADAAAAAPKVKLPAKAKLAKSLVKKSTPPPADKLASVEECQDAMGKVALAVLAAGAAEEGVDLEEASEDELALMLAFVAMEIFEEDLEAAEADCTKNATKAELACLNKADEFEQVIACMEAME